MGIRDVWNVVLGCKCFVLLFGMHSTESEQARQGRQATKPMVIPNRPRKARSPPGPREPFHLSVFDVSDACVELCVGLGKDTRCVNGR